MKFPKLFISVLLLSGCHYHDGCFYNFQQVTCYYGVSDIGQLQKKETLGFTDTNERWKDLEKCGGFRVDNGYFYTYLSEDVNTNPKKYEKKYYELFRERQHDENSFSKEPVFVEFNYLKEVYACMKRKGYILIDKYECKKSKICNYP